MTKSHQAALLAFTFALFGAASAQRTQVGQKNLEVGVTGGLSAGPSAEVFLHAPNLSGPIGVRGSVSAGSLNDALAPSEGGIDEGFNSQVSGKSTVLGLDGTYNLGRLAPRLDATAYAGGRYGMFSATQTTDAGSSTWSTDAFGVGGGVMLSYPVNAKVSLVGDLGVDSFFKSAITYTQDGQSETANPGDGADYEVKDARLNQPGTVLKARVGAKFRF